MNLMLLNYNGLTVWEKQTLKCVIAYYIPRKKLYTGIADADGIPINVILTQDLDKVISALKVRMKLGPLKSEESLLKKLEALKNFEKKKEIRRRRISLEDLPAGLRGLLTLKA